MLIIAMIIIRRSAPCENFLAVAPLAPEKSGSPDYVAPSAPQRQRRLHRCQPCRRERLISCSRLVSRPPPPATSSALTLFPRKHKTNNNNNI